MTTSDTILGLLACRHAKDVWVPQCKNGPTHGAEHLRLDGWAMRRSWTRWGTVGYEIKVSRSDFLNDRKWRGYLEMCNELYFVAPKGLIRPDELPPEVGLLEASTNLARLITRKKAPCREIPCPENTLSYVLICRATIQREMGESNLAYWREWLERKVENREVGYRVSRALRERVDAAESAARIAKSKVEAVSEVVTELARHGIDIQAGSGWYSIRQVRNLLAGDVEGLSAISRARDALNGLLEMARGNGG